MVLNQWPLMLGIICNLFDRRSFCETLDGMGTHTIIAVGIISYYIMIFIR